MKAQYQTRQRSELLDFLKEYTGVHFAAAEIQLGGQGHTVLNHAKLPEGMAPADYMRICFAMIDVADAVVFLPDAAESAGARL